MNVLQQTPEWHELRASKIGASDAPCIMGVGFKTPYELWSHKVGLEPASHCTPAMQRGLDLESKALKKFNEMTGFNMVNDGDCVKIHDFIPYMMCSLDGYDKSLNKAVEVKCAGKEDHAKALAGQVPEKYYPQLQHQIEVYQFDMIYYFSFDGEDGVIIEVKKDSKYIQKLIKKEAEFYRCWQDFIAPPFSSEDYINRNDTAWQAVVLQYSLIDEQWNALDKQKKALREQLISLSNGKNSKGFGMKLTKYERKGEVDYSMIPELMGIDLNGYRKPSSECWKITVG